MSNPYPQPVFSEMSEDQWRKLMLQNTRETRASVRFIAVIVGVFAALSLIGMLVIGIQIGHAVSVIDSPASGTTSSLCQSQGGPITGC